MCKCTTGEDADNNEVGQINRTINMGTDDFVHIYFILLADYLPSGAKFEQKIWWQVAMTRCNTDLSANKQQQWTTNKALPLLQHKGNKFKLK